jgi:hypothetical protein
VPPRDASPFNEHCNLLVALGLRGVIEAICTDKGCTAYKLELKIDELVAKGVLTQEQAVVLHVFRDFGNDAAHKIPALKVTPPARQELGNLIDLVEDVLKAHYQHRETATSLEKSRNARKK